MKDNSAYISYLPVLLKCFERSSGAILELGMGYSTMILHNLCQRTKRKIVSYEGDEKWYKENLIYKNDYHDINFVKDWDKIDITSQRWSMVLVDHRPARRRRIEAMRVANNANFILLHDSEQEINSIYGYQRIYPKFRHVFQYQGCKPNTAVLSNFINLNFLLTR